MPRRGPLRVCIVGCGRIADGHVEQIQTMPELATVVAVCDRERLMAEQLASRYGMARVYDDFDKLLAREQPDVVHVATPPASHVALARRAIDASCHVYVEKPLAVLHADAVSLAEHAQRRGVHLTVGYTYLFDPAALLMRELVAEGVLGDPVHVESIYGYNLDGPFGRAVMADADHWVHRLPGRLLHNTIDHLLNKLVEFVDSDEPEVIAIGKRLGARRFDDRRDELVDELRVLMSGDRVTAEAWFSSHARPTLHQCRVYGNKNALRVDYLARTVTLEVAPRLPSVLGRLLLPFGDAVQLVRAGAKNVVHFAKSELHFFAGLRNLMARFYASVRDGLPQPISTRDMLWVSWVMDRIFAQVHAEGAATRPHLRAVTMR